MLLDSRENFDDSRDRRSPVPFERRGATSCRLDVVDHVLMILKCSAPRSASVRYISNVHLHLLGRAGQSRAEGEPAAARGAGPTACSPRRPLQEKGDHDGTHRQRPSAYVDDDARPRRKEPLQDLQRGRRLPSGVQPGSAPPIVFFIWRSLPRSRADCKCGDINPETSQHGWIVSQSDDLKTDSGWTAATDTHFINSIKLCQDLLTVSGPRGASIHSSFASTPSPPRPLPTHLIRCPFFA